MEITLHPAPANIPHLLHGKIYDPDDHPLSVLFRESPETPTSISATLNNSNNFNHFLHFFSFVFPATTTILGILFVFNIIIVHNLNLNLIIHNNITPLQSNPQTVLAIPFPLSTQNTTSSPNTTFWVLKGKTSGNSVSLVFLM